MLLRHDEILGLFPRLNFGPDSAPTIWLLLLELGFWLLVVGFAGALLWSRPAWVEGFEGKLRKIAQRERLWLAVFPLSVVLIRSALLPWVPVPTPTVIDEFSYLLASDTFSHGRLTNPASPMGEHFESFHINVKPTYQSMYPPAQGFSLAMAQKTTGIPWIGVVLSVAIMCGVIYWMLLGWLPPHWAWLGGAFAVIRFGTFSYWINSYWGGSVAAIGGAILLGALPRLRDEFRMRTALLFGSGLLVLAFSRPLEGLAISVAPVLVALFYLWKSTGTWSQKLRKLAPTIALLLVGFGFMLYYNWRGTGHALVMPYAVNMKAYHISNPFLFQKPNPVPEYHHEVMRAYYVMHEYTDVVRLRFQSPAYLEKYKAAAFYAFFLWPLMLLIAPALYSIWQSELRVVLVSLLLLGLDLFAQIWPPHPHYAAPAAGAFILIALYSLRHFRRSHGRFGICLSRAVVGLMAILMLSPVLECIRDPFVLNPVFVNENIREPGEPLVVNYSMIKPPLQIERARLETELEQRPGKHLVIVHHPYHDVPSVDWIYNKADLASAKVIWARDMGYLKNRELLGYYPDRQVWFVDRSQAELIPYEQAMLPWRLALSSPSFGPARDQVVSAKSDKTKWSSPRSQLAANSLKNPTLR